MQSAAVSASARTKLTSSTGPLRSDGFWAHHGFMAPGVRAFRRLRFEAKAAVITAVFLVPICILFFSFWSAIQDRIATTDRESRGVDVFKTLAPSYQAVLIANGIARATAIKAPATEASPDLQATLSKMRTSLQTYDEFQLAEVLQPSSGDTSRTTPAASRTDNPSLQLLAPMQAAMERLATASGLILDPDADTYFLVSCLTNSLPTVLDHVSQVWSWGSQGMAVGRLEPTVSKSLQISTFAARHAIEECRSSLRQSSSANPALVNSLAPIGDALDAASRYIDATETTLSSTAGVDDHEAATSSFAEGFKLLTLLSDQQVSGLDLLNDLLQKRSSSDRWTRNSRVLMVVSSLALGSYLFLAFYTVTHGGMSEVTRHLDAMKSGDLTTTPSPWGTDEAADLMCSLRETQAAIRSIVSTVRESSKSLVVASSEIASASDDLSRRTERTAANLEESAATVRQMSCTAEQTSRAVQDSSTEAQGNAHGATAGGRFAEVVDTMGRINASSAQIAQIIGTIDSIAFQTNILALNASVEAARAGDQGRGFAVVANEVRQLAQRSAQAAKEIKTLIDASVEQVDAGASVVSRAGETMNDLVSSATKVNTLLSEVSSAVRDQAAGVAQVDIMLHDLDQMTQQNAALVEQSAAAASQLRDQALELERQVERFKLPA